MKTIYQSSLRSALTLLFAPVERQLSEAISPLTVERQLYCRSEHCRICNPAICQAFQEQIATGLTMEHIHPVGIGWHHILPPALFSFFKRKFSEATAGNCKLPRVPSGNTVTAQRRYIPLSWRSTNMSSRQGNHINGASPKSLTGKRQFHLIPNS